MSDYNQVQISQLTSFIRNGMKKDGDELEALSTQEKLAIIRYSKSRRERQEAQFRQYNWHLLSNQLCVKSAVTTILAISLFLAPPTTMLLGGVVALNLANGLYSAIKLPEANIDTLFALQQTMDETEHDEALLSSWLDEVEQQELNQEQNAMYSTMYRVGVGIVVGFATFALIASGASLPISIYTALFAISLFYFVQPEQEGYSRDEMFAPAPSMS